MNDELRKKIEELLELDKKYLLIDTWLQEGGLETLIDLFRQEQTKLIKEFEKIIGEDEKVSGYEPKGNIHEVSNYRRQEQRRKLEDLKKI